MHGLFRAIRYAFQGIRRNGLMSLASVISVAASLFVLAAVMLLAMNLQRIADTVEREVAIRAFLCTLHDEEEPCYGQELSAVEKSELLERINALTGVRYVRYQSKHEALEQMKRDFPEMVVTLQGYEGEANPLSDVVDVETTDVQAIEAVALQIARMPGVRRVEYGETFLDSLIKFTAMLRWTGLGLTAMLLLATLLMLSNTIRLSVHARRTEIGIMKLVGATNWYIRRPFIIEGALLGTSGGLAAILLAAVAYSKLTAIIGQNIAFFSLLPPETVTRDLFLWIVGLGAATGAAGSMASLRRHLQI